MTASQNHSTTSSPNHLITAITAALQAGKAILEIYHSGDFDIEIKGDNSPLTKADTASHNVIMSYLETTNIPVLSEEGRDIPYQDRKDWKQLWIVDPIDGTKEFIKRNGEFTVNIALIENQKPIIGVIFVPVTGELYFSSKELGAFKVAVDLEDYDVKALLSKSNKLPLQREDKTFTIVASRSHMSPETEDVCAANARPSWRGTFNLKRKLFKTMHGGRRYCQLLPPFCTYHGVGYRCRPSHLRACRFQRFRLGHQRKDVV